jgi:uncharacterized membrane protein YkvI
MGPGELQWRRASLMLFNLKLKRRFEERHGRANLSDAILAKHLSFIYILSLVPKYDTTTSRDVPWAVTLPICIAWIWVG